MQIVESQQVFTVAKKNVSAISAYKMNKTDMSSTTANAATSQFLRLPPEIRSRIYDYVFGSKPVSIQPYLHVEQRPKRVGYKISMCTCEHDHTQLSPRVRFYDHEKDLERVCTEACPNCTAGAAQRSPACKSLSLQSLQVCRQIYHEAALKPFQQALFVFDFGLPAMSKTCLGLPAVMNALVPAQLKAVARLRLLSVSPHRLDPVNLPRLEGLKHFEMQFNWRFQDSDYMSRQLEDFANDSRARTLVKFNLKSVRAELGIDGPNLHNRRLSAFTGRPLKSPNKDDARILEEVLKSIETDLIGSCLRGNA
jgi:hypothetical protein